MDKKPGINKIIDHHHKHTALHLAVLRFDVEQVKDLLRHGADITRENRDGKTPLHLAAGHDLLLSVFASHDIDMGMACSHGKTLLHETARLHFSALDVQEGQDPRVAAIENLIKQGLLVDARDHHGKTPLMEALETGNVPVARHLVTKGAQITALDKKGATAMHYAVRSGDIETVRFVLATEARKYINQPAFESRYMIPTPLGEALKEKFSDIADVILEKGVSPNSRGERNWTPLHFVASLPEKEGGLDIARLLLERGADIDKAKSASGETPVHIAASHGNEKLLDLFVRHGASVGLSNNRRETALHHAAKNMQGHKVTGLLLNHGCDPDEQTVNGATALHLAATHNRLATVQILLERGANPLLKDAKGRTPDLLCQGEKQTGVRSTILRAQKQWVAQRKPVDNKPFNRFRANASPRRWKKV